MILLLDGFDSYGTSNGAAPVGLPGQWASIGISTASSGDIEDGRITGNGKSLELNTANSSIKSGALTTHNTLIVGFAVHFMAFPPFDTPFLQLWDGATLGMNVRLDLHQFVIRRGSTVLQTVNIPNASTVAWLYFEFKVVTANSGGSYELRINGVTVAQNASTDTQQGSNAFHDQVEIVGVAGDGQQVDDLFILDGSGSANNDFLGSRKIITLFPTAEGDSSDFTPSTGSDNSALMDDNPHNSDTDYVESSTSGHTDLYQYGNLSGVGAVNGVSVITVAKQSAGEQLKTHAKSGTTDSEDAGQAVGASYGAVRRILEQNPDTAAAWSASEINSAQFGIEVA